MRRFVLLFTALLLSLFTLELLDPVQAAVIQPFTGWLADISAAIIMPFDEHVRASGRIISHTQTGFAVSIEAGCNGVEAAIVLIAGVLAFPAPMQRKVVAIFLGFLAIQVMNIARIISLFYLGQWNLDVFTWTHLYLWPVLIMLDVLVVFMLYLRYLSQQETVEP
ncbi:exosortase H [Congregibacter litoralis]|uniref:Exosortase H, IPTLxxWG-CTERM-specific n=1 Tax=Congregibacter litoralis KT71 TaxID=314285 RepID=A4A8B9_9GAMM|nr:exosortase H [Congregibacter litoralis]EAQ97914.1 exosortase H, IPTLxxWG-CTERM-specific [Congregibacter litoralis KT71]